MHSPHGVQASTNDDVVMTYELSVAEVLRAVGRVDGDPEVARAHLDALDHLVIDRDLLLAAMSPRRGPSVPSTGSPYAIQSALPST